MQKSNKGRSHLNSINVKLVQMTPKNSGSSALDFHTVTDPEQAQLLSNETSKAFFTPFLEREHSAKSAAEALGCSLNTLLYRIKVFLEAGLLTIVRREKRKGRAVKIYRSSHPAYFIPFELTPYATPEEKLLAEGRLVQESLLHSYSAVLADSNGYGRYLFRDEDAVVSTHFPPERNARGLPVFHWDCSLRLKKPDAVRLRGELEQLFSQYSDLSDYDDARADEYLLMLTFLPSA